MEVIKIILVTILNILLSGTATYYINKYLLIDTYYETQPIFILIRAAIIFVVSLIVVGVVLSKIIM